ncbi:hypothetical protein ABE47_32205 [Bacillus thuringiensis]|uniref:Uncharacterized protein n=1 Tax=Bacillus thuringiensis YBT-1518 TaxID=529122 RepID=A0A9W3KIV9_BACTU|nr:hypothetical protein YBT1518_32597 [Bacillus thuringiensis YBT-1518]MBG9485870.1 hypothetical protein [Bacillus thuringiensis]MBG9495418.1 hypothetical protein [Bacillus thuringiensis]MBG9500073.1 hypothetical protein [Bacillus thuringiensis]MBG9504962.1 hypothetical protein [Bacillus thuringiensis]
MNNIVSLKHEQSRNTKEHIKTLFLKKKEIDLHVAKEGINLFYRQAYNVQLLFYPDYDYFEPLDK